MIPSLEGMEPVDYARYIAITFGFLVTSFSREKTFLRADVLCCVGMGVGWLCFPNVFLEFQVSGPINQAHLLYARALGAGFLFMAAPILLNKRTRDDKVFTSIFFCRIMGFSMMLISLFYSHWKFSKSEVHLTARQFWFAGLAIVGWIFGNLRHLLVSGGAANSSVRHPVNRLGYHILADLALCFPATMYILAFAPQSFVDLNIKVNADDGFLSFASYSIASFGLADNLYVLSAHSFDDTEAVKNVFKYRLAAVAFYTVLQTAHGLLQTNMMMMMLFIYAAIAINSLLALRFLDPPKTKRN